MTNTTTNTTIKVTDNEKAAINILFAAKGQKSDIVYTDAITSRNMAAFMGNLVRKGLLVIYKEEGRKVDFGLTEKAVDFVDVELTPATDKAPEKKAEKKAAKKVDKDDKKPQSAYAIMLDILCANPQMTKAEFKQAMDKTGIEYKDTAFTTAFHSCRSIFRRLGLID